MTDSIARPPVPPDTLTLPRILSLAARSVCGLEPGVSVRVRAVRRAEWRTWQGVEEGDVCLSMDFDLRAAPKADVEAVLPLGPVYAPRALWVAAVEQALRQIPGALRAASAGRARRAEARA